MSHINIFTHRTLGNVTVITKNNKEYFDATEVAKILKYKNAHDAIIRHCKEKGVVFHEVVLDVPRKNKSISKQTLTKKFIDEANVYRLILRSKNQQAKVFEEWVMEEILPSIRKNGYYIDNKYIALAESLKNNDDGISIGNFSKIINYEFKNIGRNNMYEFLRESGYLIKGGKDKNMPKQIYVKQGLFKIEEKLIYNKYTKEEQIICKTLITAKGQNKITDKLKSLKKLTT